MTYDEARAILRELPNERWLELRGQAVTAYLESGIHPEGEGLGSSDMFHITANALAAGDIQL